MLLGGRLVTCRRLRIGNNEDNICPLLARFCIFWQRCYSSPPRHASGNPDVIAPRNPVFAKYEKLDVTDGWFEVYRLPGGVYALFEPRQSEKVFSYLMVGEKRALLFDSGFGIGHMDAVVKRLTTLPCSF